jgi:hypothetical protein
VRLCKIHKGDILGLKEFIRRKKIIVEQRAERKNAIDFELELPGEPMIYSIKFYTGCRQYGQHVFRNQKFRSILKCHFPYFSRLSMSVVLLIKFYVPPPETVQLTAAQLRHEKMPAAESHELSEYLLSFMEMLHHVLINSYRQIVKIDMEKYYSSNPRTTLKFMKWEDYVSYIRDYDPDNPASQGVSARQGPVLLQPEQEGDGRSPAIHPEATGGDQFHSIHGPSACDSALPNTTPISNILRKTPTAAYIPAYKTTRRGQSGEIPE